MYYKSIALLGSLYQASLHPPWKTHVRDMPTNAKKNKNKNNAA